MSDAWVWKTLGIKRTTDQGAIRKAYAERLKAMDPDADVAGFSRLRSARDTALAVARNAGAAPSPLLADDEPAVADAAPAEPPIRADSPLTGSTWPHAAPVLPQGASPSVDPIGIAGGTIGDRPFALPWLAAGSGTVLDLPLPDKPTFGPIPLPVGVAIDETAVVIGRRHDRALHALLFPEEGDGAAPLSRSDEAQARGHLTAILNDAAHATLQVHDQIEMWLGRVLAEAWPRSAPLLEPAAQAFGWEREAGKLGERPEIAFLVPRLKGIRFHARVLEKGHPLHKAWKELERPGRAPPGRGFLVNRGEVHQLIDGVRKNFPELEHFWDPQRVASWEVRQSGGSSESRGPGYWVWFAIAFGVIRLLASGFDSTSHSNPVPPAVENLVEQDVAVAEVFGGGQTIGWLTEQSPELATLFKVNLSLAKTETIVDHAGTERLVGLVRERVDAAARKLGGADLDKAMRLRLEQLKAVKGTDACIQVIRGIGPTVKLPEWVRKQERSYAKSLLLAGVLTKPEPRPARSAMIPGELVDKVIKSTGLDEAAVSSALQNKGNDANRCAVEIALLEATLKYKGKGREAILQIL